MARAKVRVDESGLHVDVSDRQIVHVVGKQRVEFVWGSGDQEVRVEVRLSEAEGLLVVLKQGDGLELTRWGNRKFGVQVKP